MPGKDSKSYLVIGDIIIDHIMIADCAPPPGGEIVTTNTSFRLGGSGCNTAVCFSKLENETSLVAHLGSDPIGKLSLLKIEETSIDQQFIEVKDSNQSGFFFIFVEKNGQRTMYGNRGTNIKPVPYSKMIPRLDQFYGLHVSGYSLIDDQQEESIWQVFTSPHASNLVKSIDPGYNTIQTSKPTLIKYLPHLDFLLMSNDELDCWREGKSETDFIQQLLDQGVKNIIVKRGSEGSEWFAKNIHAFSSALKHDEHPVLDTTGAGDCFNAGFLFGYSRSHDPETCLLLGNIMAFLSITSPLGLESMREKSDFIPRLLEVCNKVCDPESLGKVKAVFKS